MLGRTVGELERSMTSSEFSEWIAFYQSMPFGPERDNAHSAKIAALLANVHRRANTPAFTEEDFMIRDRDRLREVTTQRTLKALMAMARPA